MCLLKFQSMLFCSDIQIPFTMWGEKSILSWNLHCIVCTVKFLGLGFEHWYISKKQLSEDWPFDQVLTKDTYIRRCAFPPNHHLSWRSPSSLVPLFLKCCLKKSIAHHSYITKFSNQNIRSSLITCSSWIYIYCLSLDIEILQSCVISLQQMICRNIMDWQIRCWQKYLEQILKKPLGYVVGLGH